MADQAEKQADFNQVADERYAKIVASGKAVPWSDMRRYLQDRAEGKKTARPVARKLAP